MNIIVATSFNAENAQKVERMMDCIYWLSGQQPCACLLVSQHGVHDEVKIKVKLAAEVAFASASLIQIPPKSDPMAAAARAVSRTFRHPWLWLEPQCVPLKKDWLKQIVKEYEAQPRRYAGPHLISTTGIKMLSRVAVYANDAMADIANKENLYPMSSKMRLIQDMPCSDADSYTKVREDAVLLYGDATGELVEKIINDATKPDDGVIKVVEFNPVPTPAQEVPRVKRKYTRRQVKA